MKIEGLEPDVTLMLVLERTDSGWRLHHIEADSIAPGGKGRFVPLRHVSKQRGRIFELEDENSCLRELVRDMWHDIPKSESCGWDMSTNTCTGSDECIGECSYWYRMRELGIEED